MPNRPGRLCPRCRQVIAPGVPCAHCATPDARESSHRRGYDAAHRGFRAAVLARDPVCVLCRAALSCHADHYPMTKRDLQAAGLDENDPARGRGLCASCHSRTTAQDERTRGGWNARTQAYGN